MLKALWKRIAPWLPWAGVLVLLALLIQAVHPAALGAALQHANRWLLLPVVGCVLAALVLRGIRWHLLLKPIAAPNTLPDSLILFTAAQAAFMIPGGQFLLPVLQRSQYGTLVRRSIPTILVQELVYGLLVLPAALPGVPPYHPAGWMLLVAFLFNAGTGIFLLQRRVLSWALGLVEGIPFLRRRIHDARKLQEHFVVVASSKAALWGTIFDMGAIGLAGLGLFLSLRAVGALQITWVESTAVYSLGSSVGTLSALPGGVGANEDVSTLALSHLGLAAGPAAAATLLFRAMNVVVNTGVGWIVLLLAGERLKIHPSMKGLAEAVHGAEKQTVEGPRAEPAPEHYLRE
jgi:uncharacterized membrane protein YbhN (UPF0104 family)